MSFYEDRAAYRVFVDGLVDEAVRRTREYEEELTAENIAAHVRWDSVTVDELIQERITEFVFERMPWNEVRAITDGGS